MLNLADIINVYKKKNWKRENSEFDWFFEFILSSLFPKLVLGNDFRLHSKSLRGRENQKYLFENSMFE